MNYRPLGKTGLSVSSISFGTVSLGVDYGIAAPDEFGRPDSQEAIRLLEEAFALGINLFDTAPAYGVSELLLGEALGARKEAVFASKVIIPPGLAGERQLRRHIETSLQATLTNLQRDHLDLLQIHNATLKLLNDSPVTKILTDMQKSGAVRFLGASVYSEEEAIAALATGAYDALQVPFNILDQRMAERVFQAATAAGVAVICRSALLKGVLSPKAQWLPEELRELRERVNQLISLFGITHNDLPSYALRFCLSQPQISTVLAGARTLTELRKAICSADEYALPARLLAAAADLKLTDEKLWNPSFWPIQ